MSSVDVARAFYAIVTGIGQRGSVLSCATSGQPSPHATFNVKIPVAVFLAALLQACPGGSRADGQCDRTDADAHANCARPAATQMIADSGTDAAPAATGAGTGTGPASADSGKANTRAAIQSAWSVCPPQPPRDYTPAAADDTGETHASGTSASRDAEGNYRISGDATVQRGNTRIHADEIDYSTSQSFAEAHGNLIFDNPDERITAASGRFWIDEKRGEVEDARYRLYSQHAHGNAEQIFLQEPATVRLKDANYTTCPDGTKVWVLKSSDVTLDKQSGFGTARNTSLEIQGVPMFWFPYFSFPIDDRRKTGFLVPSIGSSDNSGLDIRIPYYLNLAPNYDATFTPRYLQDRGVQLNARGRYLFAHERGDVGLEYLPKDRALDESRYRFTLQDTNWFTSHITTRINYDQVSDKRYLKDLSDSLSLASTTFLPRSAQAGYASGWWNAAVQVDDYQLLDETVPTDERPYQRLPRMVLNMRPEQSFLGTRLGLDSEFVNFFDNARVRGRRTDLWPRLSWPVRRSLYEITPSLSYRYTYYNLENQDPGTPDTLSRGTPVASLDGRLFFERNTDLFSNHFVQTLEPRLFYVYVPGRNQNDIPLFDSSVPTFTYRELFRENRFYGADRMGDANQVALSLATRLLDRETGVEAARFAIGQLYYFENRTVMLDNSRPDNTATSNIAGELSVNLNRSWSALSDLVLNPRDTAVERTNFRLQYNPGFRRVANFGYRYRRGEQNQIDTSVLWPLGDHWHVVGRLYYDIGATKPLENLGGIEYQSCCWSTQLVVRSYLDDVSGNTNRTILLQFTLKGLTSLGSDVDSALDDGILGYTRSPEK